jgi:dCTP deaminase
MSFWSADTWRSLDPKPVQPFDDNRLEPANYLLSIGPEIYVSEEEGKGKIRRLDTGEAFTIDPGQFAFLLTEETVCMPPKTIGFISIRAKIKFLGLVNVSGFHVDPGYHGQLIFAVFNAGPTRIHLKRSDPIFMFWIADLDSNVEAADIKSYSEIPTELVTKVSGNFTTAYQVQKQVTDIKTEISAMKSDIGDLKSFRNYLYLVVAFVITLLGIFLFPVIRDSISKGWSGTAHFEQRIEQ